MAEDTEERIAALEAKVEGLYRIMAQAAEAVKDVRHRLEEENGRSGASLIITMALVQALGRVAPEVLNGMIKHIEHVEEELAKNEDKGEGDAATARELAECRVALRAVRQVAGSGDTA
jgi:Mg2+ and Co2+ transporter CorA